jgi:hypothetical protein
VLRRTVERSRELGVTARAIINCFGQAAADSSMPVLGEEGRTSAKRNGRSGDACGELMTCRISVGATSYRAKELGPPKSGALLSSTRQ